VSAEVSAKLDAAQLAVSAEVSAKIAAGAVFVVLGSPDDGLGPLMCGTFVGEAVALTAAHDDSIRDGSTIVGRTIPRPGAPRASAVDLQFVVVHVDKALDFAVLRLLSPLAAPAFIPLPPVGYVPVCTAAGLVTMSIGASKAFSPRHESAPAVAAYKVFINKVSEFHHHYAAHTWAGDSGGALIVHGGYLIGLHVEAVSEFSLEMGGVSPARGSGGDGASHTGGSASSGKRRLPRVSNEELLEHFSSVSSSHGHEAIALQVSLPAVRRAVEAAAHWQPVATTSATAGADPGMASAS
jgi:hypothetical protein